MSLTVMMNGEPVGIYVREGRAWARAGKDAKRLSRDEWEALPADQRPSVAIIVEPAPKLNPNYEFDAHIERLARRAAERLGIEPDRTVSVFKAETMTDREQVLCANKRLLASPVVASFWQTLRRDAARQLAIQLAERDLLTKS